MFGINFVSLYYESISSPFLIWRAYLDMLCEVVFNVSHRFILPLITSGMMQIVEILLSACQKIVQT